MSYTKPELRERIKDRVMAGSKGGKRLIRFIQHTKVDRMGRERSIK